jgi:hypothetical protein
MTTPIEALSQEREQARNEWFGDRSQTATLVAMNAADGFNAGFLAGAKAASGQTEALAIAVEALEKYKDMVYIYGGSYTPEQSFAAKTALEKIKALSGAGKGEG